MHDIYPNTDTKDMLGAKCKWTHTHTHTHTCMDSTCMMYVNCITDRYRARPSPHWNRKFVLPKLRYQWFTSVSLDPAWNNTSYLTLYTDFSVWVRIFLNVKYIVFPWAFFFTLICYLSLFSSLACPGNEHFASIYVTSFQSADRL
jgi:hypothetical protein